LQLKNPNVKPQRIRKRTNPKNIRKKGKKRPEKE
jgi:hypothetical protein